MEILQYHVENGKNSIREYHYRLLLSLSSSALLNTSFVSIANSKIFTGIIFVDSRRLTWFLVRGYPSITTLHTNRKREIVFLRNEFPINVSLCIILVYFPWRDKSLHPCHEGIAALT